MNLQDFTWKTCISKFWALLLFCRGISNKNQCKFNLHSFYTTLTPEGKFFGPQSRTKQRPDHPPSSPKATQKLTTLDKTIAGTFLQISPSTPEKLALWMTTASKTSRVKNLETLRSNHSSMFLKFAHSSKWRGRNTKMDLIRKTW